MIDSHFTTVAEVYRLEGAPSDTRTYGASPAFTVRGVKMPASAEDEALMEGAYDEVSKFFCEIADIQKSDKLRIGGEDFFISAFRRFDNDIGTQQHMELIIYKPNG